MTSIDTKSNPSSNTPINNTVIRRDNEEYKVVRKLPLRFPKDSNDIYITNKTDLIAQSEKCRYLIRNFDKNDHLVLHAMGPAINRYAKSTK